MHKVMLIGIALFFSLALMTGHVKTASDGLINMTSFSVFSFKMCLLLIVIEIAIVLFQTKSWKGWRYAFYYWKISTILRLHLQDAGFGIDRILFVRLPKIKLTFDNNFSTGTLQIENTVRFNKRLDEIDMSAALGKFKIERHYMSNDANYHIYEFIDAATSFKITFDSIARFQQYSQSIDQYKLFMDARNVCQLQHTLIVGQTGSGKTYTLFSFILQMIMKDVRYELYFADPKLSSTYKIGEEVNSDRTASQFDDIVALLESFVAAMQKRQVEFKEYLNQRLDCDFTYFNLSPHILIFDEYAAFSSRLQKESKATRDHVSALIYDVILMGRQLGFFVFLVMQKSDAKLIDTALRDNMPLKIVLGNAEDQTYVTTFGTGVDIPALDYKKGDGVFTEPTLAVTPKLVQFSTLNFDLDQAIKTVAGVM